MFESIKNKIKIFKIINSSFVTILNLNKNVGKITIYLHIYEISYCIVKVKNLSLI